MKFGDSVDRFGILKQIGSGGMAAVYIGFDQLTEQLVAIKVLYRQLVEDEMIVKRFQREVQILRVLHHSNIVEFIDAGIESDVHFMVLEYVRGKPLSEILRVRRKLPVGAALGLIRDLASALAHAHASGVVHRDVKPANIMVVDPPWTAKILDFGVAQADDQLLKSTVGQMLGTVTYAAPEQILGRRVDERADLYSMGLVCYEMITGKNPFKEMDYYTIAHQQLADAYELPSSLEPSIPQALDPIVLKLLKGDRDQRYAKAEQFLCDLEAFEANHKSLELRSHSVYDFPEFGRLFGEATAAFDTGDLDLAHQLASDLSRKVPRAAEVCFLLGKIHTARGLIYNAIREFTKATALDPESAFYQVSLGIAFRTIRMDAQAKIAFETALQLDSSSQIAKDQLRELSGD